MEKIVLNAQCYGNVTHAQLGLASCIPVIRCVASGYDVSYVEPMPKNNYEEIVKAFKRQGGIIQMDDATDAY